MKFLKTYENNVLDNILDKISNTGIKSLTPAEDKLLKTYYKGNNDDLEKLVKNKKQKVKSLFEYDPRKDKEYFSDLSDQTGINFDFDNYSDKEIEEGRYEIMWDELSDEDIRHFISFFEIKDAEKEYKGKVVLKPYHELSKETQLQFKKYIDEIY